MRVREPASISRPRKISGMFGFHGVIRTPDVSVFLGEDSGFYPPGRTHTWAGSDPAAFTHSGSDAAESFIRSDSNPRLVWSELHGLCLVNLRDPPGPQRVARLGESPDWSTASTCGARINDGELTERAPP